MKDLILKGRPASPGVQVGQAWLAINPQEVGVRRGFVLVLKTSSMDWIEAISESVAVITEVGGMTSHAATICRELGKPCVTAVANATSIIQSGTWLSVDGGSGTVSVLE